MPSKVYSAAVVGVEAFEVEIEVHAGWGNADKIAVVGLPDTAVKESKDRVTSAICNSALRWPSGKRITINLAPADVRKEGPSFDLPIALGMLKLEENNRLPWKQSAGSGRLSSFLRTMRRKRPWWRASRSTGQVRFRRWCIFCAEIFLSNRSARPIVGPREGPANRNSISAR